VSDGIGLLLWRLFVCSALIAILWPKKRVHP